MKKVLIVLCVIAAIICVLNEEAKTETYSKEEMQEAIAKAEYEAYKRGYDEGEHYARGRLVSDEELDYAYKAGYERGYEDCLVDHGLD